MDMKNIAISLLALMTAVSCVKNEVIPTNADYSVKFAVDRIDIAKTGETKIVGIETSGDWTLSCDSDWVKVSPESGNSATKDITVSVDSENSGEDAREAMVILKDLRFPVNKDTLIVCQKSNAGFDGQIKNLETFQEFLSVASSLSEAEKVEFASDVDMKGAAIKPIETFEATLDGKGHKLYNFTIESENSLSGFILENKGTIKNLVVGSADGETWDKTTLIKFAEKVQGKAAGVVAVNFGKIENVKNFAAVEFNAAAAEDASVGGVAGMLNGSNATLADCFNGGSVSFSGIASGRAHQGGILGFNPSVEGATIQNCVNKGSVVKSNINQKEFTMGGVVARTNVATVIKNCKNYGLVSYSATETPGSYLHIGGILGAGYLGASIEHCINEGELFSCINQVNRMGGIVGTVNTGGSVSNCRNLGKVGIESAGNNNWQAVGGIIGFEEKASSEQKKILIKDCSNAGEIYAFLNNSTTHANKIGIGGVAGILCSSFAFVENNTNQADIRATNKGAAGVYAGGLIGWYLKGTGLHTKGNVNSGTVSVEVNDGAAGGIIGNSSVGGSKHEGEENKGAIICNISAAIGAVAGINNASILASSIMGSVNAVEINAGNFADLIQGSASKGSASGCFYGGTGVVDYIVVNPKTLNYSSSGEDKTIEVSSNCEWTVSSSELWLKLNVSQGSSEITGITATAEANTLNEPRSATITFVSKSDASKTATVDVVQAKYEAGLPDKKIKNFEDLKKFISTASEAAAGDVYTLEADIDCGGVTITSIPTFSAVLDGQNHKIGNFRIESGQDLAGFFLTNDGVVKNLVFGENGFIGFSSGVSQAVAAGFIAINNGLVENVSNYASVDFNVPSSSADASVAGIAGQLKSENAKVKGCKNYGNISLSGVLNNRAGIAGVVGTTLITGANIEDCHNFSAIAYTRKNEKELALGGVVARAQATALIKNCTNEGAVSYTYSENAPSSYLHIAGVIGAAYTGSEIIDCVNKARISACIKQTVRLGGIVATMNTGGRVVGCTNSGIIDFSQDELASKIWFAIGGIVGFEEKATETAVLEISSCINNAQIAAALAHSNNAHANKIGVGGILGSSCSYVSLNNNTNNAEVGVKNTGETPVYCGGILGFYQKLTKLRTSANMNNSNISVVAQNGAVGGVFGNISTAAEELKEDGNLGAVSFGENNNKCGSIAGTTTAALKSCKVGGSVNSIVLNAENFNLYIQGTSSTGVHSGCSFAAK